MKSGRSMNRRQLEDVTKSGLKLWYYPKVSLEVATPSNMPEHLDVKFDDWKQIYGMDILPEIKKNGQLDPNFVRWNGRAWVIEPGQSRWRRAPWTWQFPPVCPTTRAFLLVR